MKLVTNRSLSLLLSCETTATTTAFTQHDFVARPVFNGTMITPRQMEEILPAVSEANL